MFKKATAGQQDFLQKQVIFTFGVRKSFCSGIPAGDSNTWMHSDSLWETIWKTSYQKISSVLLTAQIQEP